MSCIHATAYERTPIELMDRVKGANGQLITQAAIASVSYEVFEYGTREDAEADLNGEQIGTAATLDPEDVIFDELQNDPPWNADRDPDGYNFRFTLPAASRPTGGTWHVVQVWLTPTDGGGAFPLVWFVRTLALAGTPQA